MISLHITVQSGTLEFFLPYKSLTNTCESKGKVDGRWDEIELTDEI